MSRISCSICYDIISSESVLLHLDCGHIYHNHCLTQWMRTSKTCPECRKKVTKTPSRVYPNFEITDEDVTLQLVNEIEILENRNKKLEEQLTQINLNKNEIIIPQLVEKTREVIKVTNSMKSLEQLYIDSRRKNDELSKTNEEVTEQLNFCRFELANTNEMLADQYNASTNLITKIKDLEKELQFAESDAQMDKYFRTMATDEKERVIEQLADTQRQLFEAQNTIERNFLEMESIVNELDKLKMEKHIQTKIMKEMEETVSEREMQSLDIEQENRQLKSHLEQMINQGTVSLNIAAQKRKFNDCCNIELVKNIKPKYISESIDNIDQPPIKVIFRKNKTDSNFTCTPVL